MNSKAFTLVELLGVLIILAIIFMLVFPSVSKIMTKSEEVVYQKQINRILTAAYDYSLNHIKFLPEKGKKTFITLGELKYEGLIDNNIKNSDTKENFPDNLVISINNVGAGYKYSNIYAKLEGDYLYTVEIDLLNNTSIKNLLPVITLEGLTKNSDGNYITTLNLNEKFNEYIYSAISNDGINLTDKVVRYITKDDKVVKSVDTSTAGIYKVIYSVIDNKGYSNVSILNIIIADTTSPTITFPDNSTISKNVTSFNLMDGVICKDNSGFCDIETSGEINYGVEGKYIITYIVKDPSGNTIIKKRVITVK